MSICPECKQLINEEDTKSYITIKDKHYQLDFLTSIGGQLLYFHKECFHIKKVK